MSAVSFLLPTEKKRVHMQRVPQGLVRIPPPAAAELSPNRKHNLLASTDRAGVLLLLRPLTFPLAFLCPGDIPLIVVVTKTIPTTCITP